MTTAHRPRPVSIWLAHHELPICVAYTVTFAVFLAAPDALWLEIAVAVVIVAALSAVAGLLRHERVFCRWCIDESPPDGPAEARRAGRALRYIHAPLWADFLLRGGCVVGMWWWPWLYVALWVSLCVDARARQCHRRLRPWCPWCHPPRDGNPDSATAPLPLLRGTR